MDKYTETGNRIMMRLSDKALRMIVESAIYDYYADHYEDEITVDRSEYEQNPDRITYEKGNRLLLFINELRSVNDSMMIALFNGTDGHGRNSKPYGLYRLLRAGNFEDFNIRSRQIRTKKGLRTYVMDSDGNYYDILGKVTSKSEIKRMGPHDTWSDDQIPPEQDDLALVNKDDVTRTQVRNLYGPEKESEPEWYAELQNKRKPEKSADKPLDESKGRITKMKDNRLLNFINTLRELDPPNMTFTFSAGQCTKLYVLCKLAGFNVYYFRIGGQIGGEYEYNDDEIEIKEVGNHAYVWDMDTNLYDISGLVTNPYEIEHASLAEFEPGMDTEDEMRTAYIRKQDVKPHQIKNLYYTRRREEYIPDGQNPRNSWVPDWYRRQKAAQGFSNYKKPQK